jgi:hypothetical protein
MIKKDIQYPIFLKIANQMDDTFWKYIYEDLCYGKCPYGIYIQGEYICCFMKEREFSYKIDENNPNFNKDIHNLLKNKAGILSEKEKIQQKEEFFKSKKSVNLNNKKFIRENLIQSFVLQKSQENNLGIETAKRIINFLFIGFVFKLLSVKNIILKDRNIDEIKDITFHSHRVILKNFLYEKDFKVDNNIFFEDVSKKNIQTIWSVYHDNLKKKITRL